MGRLSRKDIEAVRREVEREQRFRFPVAPRVRFAPKKDPNDYGMWHADVDNKGRVKSINVTLASDEPRVAQEGWLRHELEEAARQLKGESPTKAHRNALKNEKKWLARLFQKDPKRFGDSRGTPFVKTLWLRRKLVQDAARAKLARASSAATRAVGRASSDPRGALVAWWRRF